VSAYLACGVAGRALSAPERRLLEDLRPGGVVLFKRNVSGWDQLSELVEELRNLACQPYVAVDLEGGAVNRLEEVVGRLPAASEAAAAGAAAVAALGHAAGAACAGLGIGVDLAPVVDLARPDGWLNGERRCFGAGAEAVGSNAGVFLEALETHGVAGCLKHYPGLGSGTVDSHHELPLLHDGVVEEERVFARLARPDRAVMVAHAVAPSLGEARLPASLARGIAGRPRLWSCGPVLADDLEMGALAGFGSLPERAAAALQAGCDQVLVCNALDARRAVVEHVEAWAARDPDLAAAIRAGARRVADFGRRPLARVVRGEALALAAQARRLAGGEG
jgi:beta-N-acetylhexosaminidase